MGNITPGAFSGTIEIDGVATEANQEVANDFLENIDGHLDVNLSTRASEATLLSIDGNIIKADTDNVTVVASALPAGAATAARQDTGNASLASIDGDIDVALSTRASEATLLSVDSYLGNYIGNLDFLGTIDNNLATYLPTIDASLVSLDTKIPQLMLDVFGSGRLAVEAYVSGGLIQLTGASVTTVQQAVGSNLHCVVDSFGSAISISGIAALSTAAHQVTQNASLALLDDVPTAANGAFVRGNPMLGQMDDAGTTVATENNCSVVRINAQRAMHINLRDNAGTELGTSTNPVFVSAGDTGKATYSAATTVAVAALATDFLTISGSGTKTIRINRISINSTTTVAIITGLFLIKRSAANSGGTSSSVTVVPHDSSSAAATATVTAYTANPAGLGAAVGNVRTAKILSSAATNVTPQIIEWTFGDRPGQCVVLRGTAQSLALNLNGVTVTNGSFSVEVEFTEE